jgi:proteasome accessory factor B
MDKVERLMNLTATLLHTPGPITAEEIRERVAGYPEGDTAFHRAFERDKEALREMGMPISVEAISYSDPPVDGYRIRPSDYRLDDPGLEADELATLNLALSMVRIEGVEGVEALWKLGGEVGSGGDRVVDVPNEPALVPLFGAVLECRPASFTYRSGDQARERVIDPYRLDFQRGHWYVLGRDHLHDDERRFRLDRITGGVEVGAADSFARPESSDESDLSRPWEFGDEEPTPVQLLVDHDQVLWARQYLGSAAAVEERPDGSAVFTVPVRNWPPFRSFAFTFLDHATVLGPPAWRADIIAWLRHLAGERSPS